MTAAGAGGARQCLCGGGVLLDEGIVEGRAVLIEGARILDVVPAGRVPGDARATLPPGSLLAPGFIDVQVNGGGGVQFNDAPTAAAARAIAAAHRRYGTTSVLPTLITDVPGRMAEAAKAARDSARDPASGVLGVHFEGPFLSRERPGVHLPAHIRQMTPGDVAFLRATAASMPEGRVVLTLAPEEVADADLVALASSGVILSAGHTAASAERAEQAVALGLRGFTHLFNAMPPLAGRAPGPVAAGLLADAAWCGVIADAVHVHPAALRLVLRAKPAGRVFLVTDAMAVTGTDARAFRLNGRLMRRREGRLVAADGTLAGADIDMAAAVRNAIDLLGIPPGEALRMASAYPADFLGVTDRGRIRPGARADLVLLDAQRRPLGTWLAGTWLASTLPVEEAAAPSPGGRASCNEGKVTYSPWDLNFST